jgi:hypothetical protein
LPPDWNWFRLGRRSKAAGPLILDRHPEQIGNVVEFPLPALSAVTPRANILCPSDQACSDGEDRGSKRPERGEVAPVRRLPDDPHQPDSADNNRGDYHYRPQAARL